MLSENVAKPGDSDLELDLDNITLGRLDIEDLHFKLEFVGGFGTFLEADSAVQVDIQPGESAVAAGIGEIEFEFEGLHEVDLTTLASYKEKLLAWQQQATPLRLLYAPSKQGLLMEDYNSFLVLPLG